MGEVMGEIGAFAVGGGAAKLIGKTSKLFSGKISKEASGFEMFRKTQNTGPFADLKVPMQQRAVVKLAKESGIGLSGVKVRIIRDPELVNGPFFGRTTSKGVIELYPRAFTDAETLITTLGHERTHVYQLRTFGTPMSSEELNLNEKAAYAVENLYWQYYLRNNASIFNQYEVGYGFPRLAQVRQGF